MIYKNRILELLTRCLVIVNLSLAVSYPLLWVSAGMQELFWRADFTVYYTGATILREHKASQLYDLDLQTEVQQSLLTGNSFKDGLLPYNYPPYIALVFLPLSFLSLRSAYLVFTLLQVFFLVFWLAILARLSKSWPREERLVWAISILAYPPILINFLLGNLALWVTVGVTFFYLGLKRNTSKISGFALAISAFKPHLALVPAWLTIFYWQKRHLLSALIAGSAYILATLLIIPTSVWQDYLRILVELSSISDQYGIVARDMVNFRGALVLLFGEGIFSTAHALNLAAFLSSLIFIAFIWSRGKHHTTRYFDLLFSASILLGMLFNPHIYPQDSLLLVLPAFIFYQYLRENALLPPLFRLFILSTPGLYMIFEILLKNQFPFHWPFIVILVLLIWITRTYFKTSFTFARLEAANDTPKPPQT